MSSAVISKSLCSVSKLSPPARALSITVTGVRVPRIIGLPWQILGSITMRSFMVSSSTAILLLLPVFQKHENGIQVLHCPVQLGNGIRGQFFRLGEIVGVFAGFLFEPFEAIESE